MLRRGSKDPLAGAFALARHPAFLRSALPVTILVLRSLRPPFETSDGFRYNVPRRVQVRKQAKNQRFRARPITYVSQRGYRSRLASTQVKGARRARRWECLCELR